MEPTLREGDLAIVYISELDMTPISKSGSVRPGGLYLLKSGVIRRIEWRFESQQAVISCDNMTRAVEKQIVPFKKVQLWGKVIWRAGRI